VKNIIVGFISLLLISCNSMQYVTKSFELGKVYTVAVGMPMLQVETGDKTNIAKTAFVTELSYSGVNDNIVHMFSKIYPIGYPADYLKNTINQPIQYNIKDSKEILYNDVKIEILEATQSTITYKIIWWGADKMKDELDKYQKLYEEKSKQGKWN
jgi:hypothetical protein